MKREKRQFNDGVGQKVSGIVAQPDGSASVPPVTVILAHGAGNDMNNPLLVAVHEGLATAGFLSVRFNFPYKEKGGRAPDRGPVLEVISSVLARRAFIPHSRTAGLPGRHLVV